MSRRARGAGTVEPHPPLCRKFGVGGGGLAILRAHKGDEDALNHITKPDGGAVGGPSTEPINAQLPAGLDNRASKR